MQRILVQHLARHDGLVTTAQALAIGCSARRLDTLVANGELERLHRGVYRSATTPIDQRQRLLAGLLAAGDRAVVSHRSALVTHEAPNVQGRLVELTCRSTSLPLRNGLVVHRSSTLGPADICRVDGMWVTTKERTLVDACAVLPAGLVVRYAEHWLSSRATTLDRVHATIDRLHRVRGASALRAALESRQLGTVVADSTAEARLGRLLLDRGLDPRHHVVVTTAFGSTFEIDWAFPEVMVGLELDGYGVHLRSVHAFDDDRLRRNDLENEGWQILNFTERHLRRQPGRVVSQVRRALERRGWHPEGAELDTAAATRRR